MKFSKYKLINVLVFLVVVYFFLGVSVYDKQFYNKISYIRFFVSYPTIIFYMFYFLLLILILIFLFIDLSYFYIILFFLSFLRGIRKVSLFTRYKCVLLFHRQFTMSHTRQCSPFSCQSVSPQLPILSQHLCWTNLSQYFSAAMYVTRHTVGATALAITVLAIHITLKAEGTLPCNCILAPNHIYSTLGASLKHSESTFWRQFGEGERGVSLLLSFPFQTFTTPPGRGWGALPRGSWRNKILLLVAMETKKQPHDLTRETTVGQFT